jgi:hypothetical protein
MYISELVHAKTVGLLLLIINEAFYPPTFIKSHVFPVHAMKAYGGVEVQLHLFLYLKLYEGEWSTLRPGHFTSRERAPCINGIGASVASKPVWTFWRKVFLCVFKYVVLR